MIKKELLVFLVVGALTVVVDYIFYQGLVSLQFTSIDIAKAFGFIVGTSFAYIANRFLTFRHKEAADNSILKFALLYTFTLITNVFINSKLLEYFKSLDYVFELSFICATSFSATINFIGMKFIVFKNITGTEKS